MNRLLVPVNFSVANEHTLQFAHALSDQLAWGMDLLYCFPVQTYNHKYAFGKQANDLGIKEVPPDSTLTPNFHTAG